MGLVADTSHGGPRYTFVLIAGSWHGAWHWHRVVQELESKGHRALALDLPGHGDDPSPLAGQDVASYARFVQTRLEAEADPVILVGHSMGGAVACQAAEYLPAKVEKLVVLCGFLLQDGQSLNGSEDGIAPLDWLQLAEAGVVSLSPDKKVTYVDPGFARSHFYADLPDEVASAAIQHLGGESLAVQYQPVRLGSAYQAVPKAYIKTLRDTMLPPELQTRMASDAGLGRTHDLDSDHSPFLTCPVELADLLIGIALHNH